MGDELTTGADAGKAAAKEHESKGAASTDTAGKAADAGKADETEKRIAALETELEKARKALEGAAKAEEARQAKEMEEKGQFKELAEKHRTEAEQLKQEIKSRERMSEVDRAVYSADALKYSVKATLDKIHSIDAETGHELSPAELIVKVEAHYDELGFKPAAGEAFTGGAGSAKDRTHGRDNRVEELEQLHKKAQAGDRQAEMAYYSLEAQLKRDNVRIPRFTH